MASIIVPVSPEVFDILEELAGGVDYYIADEDPGCVAFEVEDLDDFAHLNDVLPHFPVD